MKAHLLLSLSCICLMALEAQTSKGSIMLGGSAGYNSSNSRDHFSSPTGTMQNQSSIYSYFSLAPSFGYFIKDRLLAGINFSYGNQKQVFDYESELPEREQTYIQKNILAGLFLRKYLAVNSMFAFYAGLSAGAGPAKYLRTHVTDNVKITDNKGNGYTVNAGIEGGVAYFPAKFIALQAGIGGLGWNYHKFEHDNSTYTRSAVSANLNNLILNFGLYFFFNKAS